MTTPASHRFGRIRISPPLSVTRSVSAMNEPPSRRRLLDPAIVRLINTSPHDVQQLQTRGFYHGMEGMSSNRIANRRAKCCNIVYLPAGEGMLGSILKTHHISRADLAHRLDVSVQTIHNWCSGRILIPSRKLGHLCDLLEALGVPPDELAQMAVRELETLGVQQQRLALRSRTAQPVVGLVTWDLMNPDCSAPWRACPARRWRAWAINAWRSIAAGSTASGALTCSGRSRRKWTVSFSAAFPATYPTRTTTSSPRSSRLPRRAYPSCSSSRGQAPQ